jgi:hypothetical protein
MTMTLSTNVGAKQNLLIFNSKEEDKVNSHLITESDLRDSVDEHKDNQTVSAAEESD